MKKPEATPRKRRLALACSLALATGAMPGVLWAQDAEAEYDGETVMEEIMVTGTRIKGLDMKGAAQAVQVNQRDILESGAENIGQLMQDLTVTGGGFGTFTTSTAGPLSSESPVGSAAVSLRGLGTGSTLTLINGRRASVASFAKGQASFIDINSIPTSAIERVEILPETPAREPSPQPELTGEQQAAGHVHGEGAHGESGRGQPLGQTRKEVPGRGARRAARNLATRFCA